MMNYIRGTTKPFEGAAYVVNHEAKQIARLVAMRWTSIVGYTGYIPKANGVVW